MIEEVPLEGGVAHPGQVVRVGDTVLRPAGAHTASVAFVRRHVEAGEPAFVEMWRAAGGEEGERRNLAWIEDNLERLRRALLNDPAPQP